MFTAVGAGVPSPASPPSAGAAVPVEPGLYRAELPGDVHGELAAEVTFQRDGAGLHQRLLLAIR